MVEVMVLMKDFELRLSTPKTYAQAAFDKLEKGILSGFFQPGQQLNERELSVKLGISRTPLREALRKLERDGLVTAKPHRGWEVRRFTCREVAEIYAVQARLESMSARLAAEEGDASLVAELEEILKSAWAYHSDRDISKLWEANKSFHMKIIHGSNNTVLINLVTKLRSQISYLWSIPLLDAERFNKHLSEHEAIVKYIAEANGPAAEELLYTHLRQASDATIKILRQQESCGESEQ
jgi:DNA-binding GntR family transcriptional regulator